MIDFDKRGFDVDVLSIGGAVGVFQGSVDPSIGLGQTAPVGSLYMRSGTPDVFQKTGIADTDWTTIVQSVSTLGRASQSIPELTGTVTIPLDNSTPLITEGIEIASLTITPTSPTNMFSIDASFVIDQSVRRRRLIYAVFRDNTCIFAGLDNIARANRGQAVSFSTEDIPGGTSPVTYSIRFGKRDGDSGTWRVNALSGLATPLGSNIQNSTFVIQEHSA